MKNNSKSITKSEAKMNYWRTHTTLLPIFFKSHWPIKFKIETFFLKVEKNGRMMLRESFIMNIFKPLYKKLTELKEYLDWYFEEKETRVIGE